MSIRGLCATFKPPGQRSTRSNAPAPLNRITCFSAVDEENRGITRNGSLMSKEAALEQWEDRKKLQKRLDAMKSKLKVCLCLAVPVSLLGGQGIRHTMSFVRPFLDGRGLMGTVVS